MEEVKQLEVGEGFDVYYVFNEDLKRFSSDKVSNDVIRPSQTRIYPVTVNGEGRIMITVRKRDGIWRTSKFGQPDIALSLAKKIQVQKQLGLSIPSLFELEIPALHVSFAGVGKPGGPEGEILLSPLNAFTMKAVNPDLVATPFSENIGIKSARDAFAILSESAKRIPAGPP